jgi:hypothetical protein
MSEDFQYEKEEFRTDRAVKIPQREVDELLEELLNPVRYIHYHCITHTHIISL